ncbi:MAG: TolC family protein [Gemmatimonadaceae bacterium]|nr:TolC family protein [Gemmatimonadaceae bacterium]
MLLTLLLTGCASGPHKGGLREVEALVGARLPLPIAWVQGSAEDSSARAYARTALRGEVAADTAVRVALLRNRHLQAAFEELGIAQADVVQAGLFANPVLAGDRLRPTIGGGTGLQLLGLTVPFLDMLKAPLRRRVAASAFAATRARVAASVIDLVALVRVSYVQAQATGQMQELRETVLRATEASATAAQALRDAGNLSEYDVSLEKGFAADARLALLSAEAERRAARAELTRVLGTGADTAWHVTPRLEPATDTLPTARDLAVLARARRLDLQAAFFDVEAAGRLAGFTRAFAVLPDGTIGVAQEQDPDGTFRGVSASFELPLFDRGQARLSRAQAQFRQARARHDALAVDISAEVEQLAARLDAARARVDHLRRTVLPLRQRVVAESQRFVNAMAQSVFTLLLAKQAEIDAGQAYVEALRDYWTVRAQLERAVGGSLAPLTALERDAGATDARNF